MARITRRWAQQPNVAPVNNPPAEDHVQLLPELLADEAPVEYAPRPPVYFAPPVVATPRLPRKSRIIQPKAFGFGQFTGSLPKISPTILAAGGLAIGLLLLWPSMSSSVSSPRARSLFD